MNKTRAVVVGGIRIPFVKSFTHYSNFSNQEMLTHSLKAIVDRYGLRDKAVGDVALGAVIKHSFDWNLARESVLGSGLSPETPAYDLQRACGTSLEAVNQIALKIMCGQIEVGIAGGVDTNSDAPIELNPSFSRRLVKSAKSKSLRERLGAWAGLHPRELKLKYPGIVEPRTSMSMGEHCEQMAKTWSISRDEQDRVALASHMNAARAYESGFYEDWVIPFAGVMKDASVRGDTSLEKLSRLKAVFDPSQKGTVTAGNSSPLSDGAAVVLLASEELAKKEGYPVLAYIRDVQVSAVNFVGEEGLLMAPAYAVSELLKRNGLTLQEFDLYEIHEAFAAQLLCNLKAWESGEFCKTKLNRKEALGPIDRAKLNIFGGSVALGHPFAATGARIVVTSAKALFKRGSGRALISICTAGGMGVAAIVER